MAGLNTGGQRFAGEDGKADPRVAAILASYAAGQEAEYAVLVALAGSRLLIPLVERETAPPGGGAAPHPAGARDVDPHPGARDVDPHPAGARDADSHPAHACGSAGSAPGREMAFPTLIGRDGRPALLAFTSLEALTRWRADARPVPALAAQVWETAVADSCAVVIDVAGPVPLAVDGARLGALAKGEPPPAPQDDPDVRAQITEALAGEPAIVGAELASGRSGASPQGASGEGAGREGASGDTDLAIRLVIRPGATPPPDVQRVAEAIAARLAGRLRRGIEVAAVLAPSAPGAPSAPRAPRAPSAPGAPSAPSAPRARR